MSVWVVIMGVLLDGAPDHSEFDYASRLPPRFVRQKETAMKAITTNETPGLLSAGPRSTGWGWGG